MLVEMIGMVLQKSRERKSRGKNWLRKRKGLLVWVIGVVALKSKEVKNEGPSTIFRESRTLCIEDCVLVSYVV